MQAAVAQYRKETVDQVDVPRVDFDGEPIVQKWPRRSRFFFIAGAAALCWLVPGVAIYLMVAPY